MRDWLASSPVGSWVKTFVAVLIGSAVADWAASGSLDLDHWQTWVIAGLVAVGPVVINWLNPADARYGRGSQDA